VDTVIQCECGFEARAEDEDELVGEVQRHAWDVHGMALTHDEAMLLTFRARLNENAPLTVPRQPTTPTEEDT
jgi:predicted small metal-binding protein